MFPRISLRKALVVGSFFPAMFVSAQNAKRPVLMISIDSMNPHYVFQTNAHSNEIPFLRSLLKESAYAESVINVTPTITNPNHVTLVTGTYPAKHGIFNNMLETPAANVRGLQMEYGNAIRVKTLWEAAKSAGYTTASVNWPVTLGARGIDYNIPNVTLPHTAENHFFLETVSRPDGLVEHIEKTAGIFTADMDEDDIAMPAAKVIIREHKPLFLTVHLSGLDEAQHQNGPDSPEAFAALAKIDKQVQQLVRDERAIYPDADIFIVSDHGFFPVTHVLNLNSEFVREGLITVSQTPSEHITSWKAYTWTGGGSAAVMLQDPNDDVTRKKVAAILARLAKDPANGIARVISKQEAVAFGGTPKTEFLIDCNSGFYVGRGLTTPLVAGVFQKGTHGYLPTHTELQASFFVMGPKIAKGKDLGVIDMRQIASTVAAELGTSLPDAEKSALPIHP